MIEEVDVVLDIFYEIQQLISNHLLILTVSISLKKVVNFLRELAENVDLGLMVYLCTALFPFVIEAVKQA